MPIVSTPSFPDADIIKTCTFFSLYNIRAYSFAELLYSPVIIEYLILFFFNSSLNLFVTRFVKLENTMNCPVVLGFYITSIIDYILKFPYN